MKNAEIVLASTEELETIVTEYHTYKDNCELYNKPEIIESIKNIEDELKIRSAGGRVKKPELIIENDWDGYFGRLVQNWIDKAENPKHERVIVTGCPYQGSAVEYIKEGNDIKFSFYPALRAGFGNLSHQDVKELIELI